MSRYYEKLKTQYQNNSEVLKEIEELYQFDSQFNNFKPGVITPSNIEKYGMEALQNAIKYNKTELLKNAKPKLKAYLEEIPTSSEVYYESDEITALDYPKLKPYMSHYGLDNFTKYTYNKSKALEFIEIVRDETKIKNFAFLAKHFRLSKTDYKVIEEPQFTKFIEMLDERYFNAYYQIESLISSYNQSKNILDEIKTDEDLKKFNNYIFNAEYLAPENYGFKFNKETYYEDRENVVKRFTRFKYGSDLGDMISRIYFGTQFKHLEGIIEDARNLGLTELKMFDYQNKEELKTYLKDFYEITSCGLDLKEQSKILSKKQLAEKLKVNFVIKNNEIIKLDGQDFYLLAHKVSGLTNKQYRNDLYQNPELWSSRYEENSYISTSAISNNHIGLVQGNDLILGFDNIKQEQIMQMGPVDILMEPALLASGKENDKMRYMAPDKLIENTFAIYNEVALKRFNNNKEALMPSSVISYDYTTSTDKEMSTH